MADLKKNWQVGLLYGLMLFGGIWQITGLLSDIMRWMAGPLLIVVGLWSALDYFKNDDKSRWFYTAIWVLFIVIIAMVLEYIGSKTGVIFGKYAYSTVLQPQILGVPVAIGAAWLLLVLAANSLGTVLFPKWHDYNDLVRSVFIAATMTAFDVVLEQAAIRLNYWQWFGDSIPLQNYLAWFIIAFFMALSGFNTKILDLAQSRTTWHFYTAQLLYLGFVWLGVAR
jgi:uncharacterized membrane protein